MIDLVVTDKIAEIFCSVTHVNFFFAGTVLILLDANEPGEKIFHCGQIKSKTKL